MPNNAPNIPPSPEHVSGLRMRAAVCRQYGSCDVLHMEETERPSPKDNEILIRIYATSITYGDLVARNFKNISAKDFNMPFVFWLLARLEFGWSKPKKRILGAEFAGKVAAVGKKVTQFKPGDDVFGYRGPAFGANAEYLCMPEAGLVADKPVNMTYEEAACIPYGTMVASRLLRKVHLQPGHRVLINGASGAIGSAAVQLAKQQGTHVTGVCSTLRLDFVRALGADEVIDYTKEDFTAASATYDVVFDILGKSSFSHVKHVLKPGGRYLLASFKLRELLQMLWTAWVGDKKVICALAMEGKEELNAVKELAEAGQIRTVLDKSYPLEHAACAHRYVEEGHKKGNVVLRI